MPIIFNSVSVQPPVPGSAPSPAPGQIATFTATAVGPTQINLAWSASSNAATYTVLRGGFVIVTHTTALGFNDIGLNPSTIYNYQVFGVNAAGTGNAASASATTQAVLAAPGPISSFTVGSPTASSLLLTWSTSANATGYTVTRNGTAIATGVSSTSYTDTVLSASTTYTYTVAGTNSIGTGTAISGSGTTASALPGSIATFTVSVVSSTSLSLSWTAASGATSYTITRGGTLLASGLTGTSYVDTALMPSTSYSYTVYGVNAAGNGPSSAGNNTTAASGSVTISQVTGLITSAITASTVNLTWNPATSTPNPLSGYYVYANGGSTPVATVLASTTTTITGIHSGSTVTFTVAAFDSLANVGAQSTSVSATMLTSGAAKVAPPFTPLMGTITANTAYISYAPDTSNNFNVVAGLYLYNNGSVVPFASVNALWGTITGLSPNTTYTVTSATFDNVSPPNVGAQSAAITFTTPAVNTAVAPSQVQNVASVSSTSSSFTVSWNAAVQGTNPIAGYYVYVNNATAVVTVSGARQWTLPGVAGSSYTVTVAAFDTATPPNVGLVSAPVTCTTATAPAVPAQVPFVRAVASGSSNVTLLWPFMPGATGYTVNRNGSVLATNVLKASAGAQSTFVDVTATAGTAWTYTVQAVNSAGSGTASPGTTITVPTAVPAQVTNAKVAWLACTSIGLTWDSIANTDYYTLGGGSSNSGDLFSVGTQGIVSFGTAATVSSTFATPALTLYAINGQGKGPASATIASVNLPKVSEAPGLISRPTVTGVTSTSVTISWVAPTAGSVAPIGSYNIYSNGFLLTNVPSTQLTYTATGLASSTLYAFIVEAQDTQVVPYRGFASLPARAATTAASGLTPTISSGSAIGATLISNSQYTLLGQGLGTRPNFNYANRTWVGNTHMHYLFTDFSKGQPGSYDPAGWAAVTETLIPEYYYDSGGTLASGGTLTNAVVPALGTNSNQNAIQYGGVSQNGYFYNRRPNLESGANRYGGIKFLYTAPTTLQYSSEYICYKGLQTRNEPTLGNNKNLRYSFPFTMSAYASVEVIMAPPPSTPAGSTNLANTSYTGAFGGDYFATSPVNIHRGTPLGTLGSNSTGLYGGGALPDCSVWQRFETIMDASTFMMNVSGVKVYAGTSADPYTLYYDMPMFPPARYPQYPSTGVVKPDLRSFGSESGVGRTYDMNYTDLYADLTWARLEITDGVKTEVQILNNWVDGGVTFTYNKGELKSGAVTANLIAADNTLIVSTTLTSA